MLPGFPSSPPPAARNELEEALEQLNGGDLEPMAFAAVLKRSQLFMPVLERGGIGGFQAQTRAEPLFIESEDGQPVLILFSSPERGRGFLNGHPGYEGGILTDFAWIFEHLGGGYGIAINPGDELGFDMDEEMAAALASQITPPTVQ